MYQSRNGYQTQPYEDEQEGYITRPTEDRLESCFHVMRMEEEGWDIIIHTCYKADEAENAITWNQTVKDTQVMTDRGLQGDGWRNK